MLYFHVSCHEISISFILKSTLLATSLVFHRSKFMIGGKWADPGGTAIPGQPMMKVEQAPTLRPRSKMRLISKRTHGPRIRY